MKFCLCILFGLALCLSTLGQRVYHPSTQTDVNAGTSSAGFLTPYTHANCPHTNVTGAIATALENTTNHTELLINGEMAWTWLLITNAFKTNLANVSTTNLDNTTWLSLQASKLDDHFNFWRYGWTNILARLANRQNVRILFEGTGLVDRSPIGLFDGVYYYWSNQFPIAGCLTWMPTWWKYNSGSGIESASKTTNWLNPHVIMDADDWFFTEAAAGLLWNSAEVGYIAQTNGGDVNLYTNTIGSGTFGLATTFNTKAATRAGAVFKWTNAVTWYGGIKLSNVSGTNIICTLGVLNTNQVGGLILGENSTGDCYVSNMNAVASNVIGNIYGGLQPDMIFFTTAEGTAAGTLASDMATHFTLLTNTRPQADLLFCGEYPASGVTSWQGGASDLRNYIQRTNAMRLGKSYWDAFSAFDGDLTNTVFARGWVDIITDVHYNSAGMLAHGYLLARFLNLEDWRPAAPFTSSGVSTNLAFDNGGLDLVVKDTLGTNRIRLGSQSTIISGSYSGTSGALLTLNSNETSTITGTLTAGRIAGHGSTWTAATNTAIVHTGTTDATALWTQTVPAGALGKNGWLECVLAFTVTNAAQRDFEFKLAGTSVMTFLRSTASSGSSIARRLMICRNSDTAKIGGPNLYTSYDYISPSASMTTGTVGTDTNVAFTLVCTLTNAAQSVQIESIMLKAFYCP